jgi:hypothetical protein
MVVVVVVVIVVVLGDLVLDVLLRYYCCCCGVVVVALLGLSCERSKSFLPAVAKASKQGLCACKSALPRLHGKVSWSPALLCSV